MSDVPLIERRAAELDEYRKKSIIRSADIDVEKYLQASDVSEKVRNVQDFIDEMWVELVTPAKPRPDYFMPWEKTQASFQYRPGEVTVYAGGNGGGKSLVTGQIALGLISQQKRVCIASFEMKPHRTLQRMLRQFAGVNTDAPMISGRDKFLAPFLERVELYATNNMYFYDQQGTTNTKQVIAMARYCALELGVTDVFIDSLMKCIPGEDAYNDQKYFVDELTSLARDHNIHIHLVHHIKKLQSEEITPNKFDIKGSGSITDQVDNVLMIQRNKRKEHKRQQGQIVDEAEHDLFVMCEKQRNGEAEDWFGLYYHRDSQQFVESADSVPMSFDGKGNF